MRAFPMFVLVCFVAAGAGSAAEISLTGKVRQHFTGLPVPGATVRVFGTVERRDVERSSRTGLDGGFALALPAGEYIAIAYAAGYDAYRQGGIVLAPGAKPPVLDLALSGFSSLSGRIVDARTKVPVAGANVQAHHLTYLKGRRQRWAARTPATTGDDGEFRIERLPAGEYAIEIEPPEKRETLEDGTWTGYSRRMWPDSMDAVTPLFLRAQTEQALGTIAVERAPLQRLEIGLTGACVEGAEYTATVLAADQASLTTLATVRLGCEEKASVMLSAGEYHVVVEQHANEGLGMGAAAVSMSAGNRDLQIPLFLPLHVTGSIGFSGGEAPEEALANVLVRLRPVAVTPHAAPSPVPAAGGVFSTSLYPPPDGLTELEVSGLPTGYFVKEILYNGVRVESGFPLNLYAAAHRLRVILSGAASVLEGVVKDEDGRVVAGAAVVLVRWTMSLDANYPLDLLETRAGANGGFTFSTLKPGEYRIVAIPATLRQRYEEPHRLASAFASASTVTAGEGQAILREIVVKDD